jgi:hypothetical protein
MPIAYLVLRTLLATVGAFILLGVLGMLVIELDSPALLYDSPEGVPPLRERLPVIALFVAVASAVARLFLVPFQLTLQPALYWARLVLHCGLATWIITLANRFVTECKPDLVVMPVGTVLLSIAVSLPGTLIWRRTAPAGWGAGRRPKGPTRRAGRPDP